MTTYSFTAFAARDLFADGHIGYGDAFAMPASATLRIDITDNDAHLSGDFFRNERGDDRSGQTGSLVRDGAEVGNGGKVYAEQTWTLHGDDGRTYTLVEVEQAHGSMDMFTFLGAQPPAGVTLTVGARQNVIFQNIAYADLGAGAVQPPLPNIVEIAAGSDDFNILVKALGTAGLVEAVRDSSDITVFAPTDTAFGALAVDLGFGGDVADEDAVFGFLVEALGTLGDPVALLTDILLYHVSPGAKTAAEVDAADQITTLLTGETFGSEGAELVDNEPDVANPSIVAPDIAAANGTIQVLDRVLLPIDIPGNEVEPTLAEFVAASGGTFDSDSTDFDLLFTAVEIAGLTAALDDPSADLTVFAPNDAAFVGLAQTLGFDGSDEGDAFGYIVEALTLLGKGDPVPLLTQILTYHVAPTSLGSDEVLTATSIPTLQGGSLGVDGLMLVDADPDIANPELIATDLDASNGIAHVIDGVLLPADLLVSNGAGDVQFVIAGDKRDVIHTGADDDFVDGNGGKDTIFLGAGDDVGIGGAGRDYIAGDAGADHLIGGAGNDTLVDFSRDADTFVFRTGDGRDKVFGFNWNGGTGDKIDLSGTGFTEFDALSIRETKDAHGLIKARIDLGDDQSVTLRYLDASLTADDFIF